MSWQFLEMGVGSAQENMDTDRRLLDEIIAGQSPAIFRFYGWRQPAFSFGYSQQIAQVVDVEACQQAGLELVQRPTGGGLVIHGWEFTYSVISPSDDPNLPRGVLASYEQIHRWIVQALQQLGVSALLAPDTRNQGVPNLCLSNIAPYDVLLDGQKIAGGAQRRRKKCLLHQGYIALDSPPLEILRLAGTAAGTGYVNQLGRQVDRQTLIAAIQQVLRTDEVHRS